MRAIANGGSYRPEPRRKHNFEQNADTLSGPATWLNVCKSWICSLNYIVSLKPCFFFPFQRPVRICLMCEQCYRKLLSNAPDNPDGVSGEILGLPVVCVSCSRGVACLSCDQGGRLHFRFCWSLRTGIGTIVKQLEQHLHVSNKWYS